VAITSKSDADVFLSAVSGFHDGFIKQIAIFSDDWFDWRTPTDVGHTVTGVLRAEILFARHPTVDGASWPAVIRCVFHQVADVRLDFRRVQGESWPLYDVRVDEAADGRLSLRCAWDSQAYQQLFTFSAMDTD
jgi:hypothetical protein